MRTYSHALFTLAATRRLSSSRSTAAWATLGATFPDVPVFAGAAWLLAKRRVFSRESFDADVCSRKIFRSPDAALHSVPPVLTAFAIVAIAGQFPGGRNATLRSALALVLGWTGHVAADTLTHGTDARPILWPISDRRFRSPVSYRERDLHGRAFTVAEHTALLAGLNSFRHTL